MWTIKMLQTNDTVNTGLVTLSGILIIITNCYHWNPKLDFSSVVPNGPMSRLHSLFPSYLSTFILPFSLSFPLSFTVSEQALKLHLKQKAVMALCQAWLLVLYTTPQLHRLPFPHTDNLTSFPFRHHHLCTRHPLTPQKTGHCFQDFPCVPIRKLQSKIFSSSLLEDNEASQYLPCWPRFTQKVNYFRKRRCLCMCAEKKWKFVLCSCEMLCIQWSCLGSIFSLKK